MVVKYKAEIIERATMKTLFVADVEFPDGFEEASQIQQAMSRMQAEDRLLAKIFKTMWHKVNAPEEDSPQPSDPQPGPGMSSGGPDESA
jgi:hypothetical protein